jgi:cell division protein ZipA
MWKRLPKWQSCDAAQAEGGAGQPEQSTQQKTTAPMDADILRLILFVAGVVLILGIYFWDRHKKVTTRIHAIRRAQQGEGPALSESPLATMNNDHDPDVVARQLESEAQDSVDDFEDSALIQIGELVHEEQQPLAVESELEQQAFSFSATDDEPAIEEIIPSKAPVLILQLNLLARNGAMTGEAILKATADVDLTYGEMSIFHRLEGKAKDVPIFSMASMVEPGTFPEKLEGFTTPGITLFTKLPGPKDGLAVFSDMLFTAERLAGLLDAELQDETHSDLSKQTVEHMREKILEHRRQVQLAKYRQ